MDILRKFLGRLGFVDREELLTLYRLQLASSATSFALWEKGGRSQSNKALNGLFFGLVKAVQPELFIEAGAKKADTSVKARTYLPEAQIVAFEASPENFKKYSANPDLGVKRVDYRHSAVSDYDGEVEFHVRRKVDGEEVEANSGANSILRRQVGDTEYEVMKAPCVKLDTAFPNPVNSALWIDVEGASKNVLTGATGVLAKASVAIIEVEETEIWSGQWTDVQVIDHLYSFGLIPVARDFEFRGQYNIVFLQKSLLSNKEIWQNIEYFHSVLRIPRS